jgi:hydroxymethylglutaryl-CoA reductase
METKSSRISGFYKMSPEERLEKVVENCGLTEEDLVALRDYEAAGVGLADRMIENAIGTIQIPLGIAANFVINGKDRLIPMATEEPSVVAAASNAARLARETGGFFTSNSGTIMRAQIQATGVSDPEGAKARLFEAKEDLLELANEQDPMLVRLGGGARDIEVHVLRSGLGPMVVTHLIVDVKDAMGANAVNTMAEALAPTVEAITGGRVYLRILSNLADLRLARARTVISKDSLGGEEEVDGFLFGHELAEVDPYRAATHNKGVMNGISAVVLATGNDTRAVEAGAHSYVARSGHYGSMTHWEKNADGDLVGSIEIPMPVGLVGGATKVHPTARLAVKILGVESASELAEIIAAVGLAQNFAAVRALASEGIQRGHMSLHAKNLAAAAGASPHEVAKVVEVMVRERKVRQDRAEEILAELRSKGGSER